MSPRSNQKLALDQRSTLKKTRDSMSSKLEPVISSRDTGQRIPCFDRCQLTITWMSNIMGVNLLTVVWPPSYATPLSSSSSSSSARTSPRAIPTVMITTRKSTHGFPVLSWVWVWCSARRPLGPPELRYDSNADVVVCKN